MHWRLGFLTFFTKPPRLSEQGAGEKSSYPSFLSPHQPWEPSWNGDWRQLQLGRNNSLVSIESQPCLLPPNPNHQHSKGEVAVSALTHQSSVWYLWCVHLCAVWGQQISDLSTILNILHSTKEWQWRYSQYLRRKILQESMELGNNRPL